nr:unnamed protein product [Spirometra erinaceieuropaei]
MRADIGNCATGLLRQRKHYQVLPIDEEKGLQSLRTDDSIVIVSADKGGATAVMEKSDYVNKANQAFNDREAYTPLAEDPTKKQAAAVKKKVNELTRLKLITPDDSRCMTLNDPRIAHAYGLPKVHKEGQVREAELTDVFTSRQNPLSAMTSKASAVCIVCMQFTMDEELNNQLAFLAVQLTKLEDGKLRTTVYRKAANTRRILHFKSSHPVVHKRICFRNLFQRIQTHCSDENGMKEKIKYLHTLFKANDYPKYFMRKCLKKPHPERSNEENPKIWLTILYFKNVSEATARILKPFGIGVAH